jgi:hypothetical protein
MMILAAIALMSGEPAEAHALNRGEPPVSDERLSDVHRESLRDPADRPSALVFEENLGQWPIDACFIARAPNMIVRAAAGKLAMQVFEHQGDSVSGVLLDLGFEGACPGPSIEGIEPLTARRHYFLGKDPAHWRSNVRCFRSVRYHDLWPGIDLVLRDGRGGLEYDIVLAPGAAVEQVRLSVAGVEGLDIDPSGALLLRTSMGPLLQPGPKTFQVLPTGEEEEIQCRYRLLGQHSFGFEAIGRDPSLSLVIDPTLLWSTYLGGTGGPLGDSDIPNALALDAQKNVYLAGWTGWHDFPTTPGAYVTPGTTWRAMFISKLSADGHMLVLSSVIGGYENIAIATGIALDTLDRPTVGGWTQARDFPTTPGAFDEAMNSTSAGVVLKLDETGSSLVFSTFLEGGTASGNTTLRTLDVADSGAVVVGGDTGSADFPTTPGAYQTQHGPFLDSFLSRLSPDGSALAWSTYFPVYPVSDLVVDRQDEVAFTGRCGSTLPTTPGVVQPNPGGQSDAFVARINAQGSELVWATYLGGSTSDEGYSVGLDGAGGAVVVGKTVSPDFPITPGSVQPFHNYNPPLGFPGDGFVSRLTPDATQFVYSTYLGGIFGDAIYGVDVDPSGMATIISFSDASFPVTPGAYDTSYNGGADTILARLDPDGRKLYYSTFLGGPDFDAPNAVAVAPDGEAVVAGTSLGSFPVTPGAYDTTYNGGQTDVTVAALDLYLRGVRAHGASTAASCIERPVYLNATRMPQAGDPRFGLYGTGAPRGAAGWLVIGTASPTPTDLQGASLWLDPSQPVTRRHVDADSLGFLEIDLPLTALTPGVRFGCQLVFLNPPGCGMSSPFSTSNAVVVTVQ